MKTTNGSITQKMEIVSPHNPLILVDEDLRFLLQSDEFELDVIRDMQMKAKFHF